MISGGICIANCLAWTRAALPCPHSAVYPTSDQCYLKRAFPVYSVGKCYRVLKGELEGSQLAVSDSLRGKYWQTLHSVPELFL